MGARQMLIFAVEERKKNDLVFRLGKLSIQNIPALYLERGSAVSVIRHRDIIDSCIVREATAADNSLTFSLLKKIVPSDAKIYVKETEAGVTRLLESKWFQAGDVVRIQGSLAPFLKSVKDFPEAFLMKARDRHRRF